ILFQVRFPCWSLNYCASYYVLSLSLTEQCTSEKNTQDQWDLILRICEEYGSKEPKACLKAIGKRVFHKNPNVSIRAVTLLDACSKNCGKVFNRELASRDFSQLVKSRFVNLQRIPSIKLTEVFEKWAEEFKSDSELALAASLYSWVKSEHGDIVKHLHEDRQVSKSGQVRQNAAKLQAKEEEELAQAIALSLKESENKPSARVNSPHAPAPPSLAQSGTSVSDRHQVSYPNFANGPTTQPAVSNVAVSKGRVRALYDFEAAEDNELTFKAGELIVLLDDSDENWWRGSNHRGEGLFPAQFVKRELEDSAVISPVAASAPESTITDNLAKTTVQLDAAKMDECLRLINMVDPTGEFRPDPPELAQLEVECNAMAPLVDPELEKVDKRVLMLSDLNQQLLDAFQMYHDLMSRSTLSQVPSGGTSTSAAGYYIPGQTAASYLGFYAGQTGSSAPYSGIRPDGLQPGGSYNTSITGHTYATATNTMYPSVSGPSASMHFRQTGVAGTVPATTDTTGPDAAPTAAAVAMSGSVLGTGVTSAGLIPSGLSQSHHYYSMMPDCSVDPSLNASAMQAAASYAVPDPYTGRYATEPNMGSGAPVPTCESESMRPSGLPSYAAATQQMHSGSGTQASNPYYYGYAPNPDNAVPDNGQQYTIGGVPAQPTNPIG
ncbi:Signal transducing adaptor molecule, partial [Fasciola gigantica]